MSAPKGNDFYKLADWGKPKSYQPIELWDKFRDYVLEVISNPWGRNEAIIAWSLTAFDTSKASLT